MTRRDRARVRRPRHPRRLGRARDERADHRDDARGVGAATTRCSPAATSSRPARRSACCSSRGAAARSSSSASKNALVAGANAAAYSSAKAASLHLARCLAEEGGPHGIRVNTVNPDAVIQGSGIWSSDWKAERASTYGVDRGRPAELLPRAHEARRRRLSRGRRRGDRVLRRARDRASRPETSSTSTAASPPRIPGSAKEAHHPPVSSVTPSRERNHPCTSADGQSSSSARSSLQASPWRPRWPRRAVRRPVRRSTSSRRTRSTRTR